MRGEHFSVDCTLIDTWASMKSFRPKDGSDDDATPSGRRNAERDFRGQKRSNETRASTTDPDARLYRKGNGQSSRLCFMGYVLMENRSALIVDTALTRHRGIGRVSWMFTLTAAAYNLVRTPGLLATG